MKKIKKFNESREEIDKEYITHCFIDLLEEGAELTESTFKSIEGIDNLYIQIRFEIKETSRLGDSGFSKEFISRKNKLNVYIDNHNYNNILLQKIKTAFTLLSDEYPDYKVYSKMTNTKLIINIYPFN